jgi:hypothetical protein
MQKLISTDPATIPKCVRGYGVGHNFQKRASTTNAKYNAKYYNTKVIERILLPETQKLHRDEYYCFLQDVAPSHTANIGQR